MGKAALPPWDVQAVYRQVRARDHALTDRIRDLMTQEAKLGARVGAANEKADALRNSIAIVEKAGGNADSLCAQLAELETRNDPEQDRLNALREEMRLVRQSMKQADMAHDALHWLCFSDADLARFDAAQSAKLTPTGE